MTPQELLLESERIAQEADSVYLETIDSPESTPLERRYARLVLSLASYLRQRAIDEVGK